MLLVCPKDFGNRPTAVTVDVRRELATTRRQLSRMTGIGRLLDALPAGADFDLAAEEDGAPARSAEQLAASVEAVPAAYSPDCLSTCELGFHCRAQARCGDRVEQLGRGVRGELGSIRTVAEALAAAGPSTRTSTVTGTGTGDQDGAGGADDAAERLAYAAALRAEALGAPAPARAPGTDA